jgi:hypothetical protein
MQKVFKKLQSDKKDSLRKIDMEFPKPSIFCGSAPWYWPFHDWKLLKPEGLRCDYDYGGGDHVCLLCGDSDLKKSKRLSHDKIIWEHNKLMRAINSDLCKALDDVELKSLIHTIETSSKSVVVLYTKHENLFIQHLAKAVIDEQ